MPAAFLPPPRSWIAASWFALPRQAAADSPDLHLHVTRSQQGELRLDATLSRESRDQIQDILIDVRSPKRAVEAIELDWHWMLLISAAEIPWRPAKACRLGERGHRRDDRPICARVGRRWSVVMSIRAQQVH